MATPRMISDALDICSEAGINVSGLVGNLRLKDEPDSDREDNVEALPEGATAPETSQAKTTKNKNRYPMSVAIAKYLVTKGCLVKVLDRAFNNPPHKLCYNVGGCKNCMHHRELDEAQDQLAGERVAKHEEVELDIKMYKPETELKRKTRVKADNERGPREAKIIKDKLLEWQKQACQNIVDDFNILPDAFMTDKELQRMAKFKVSSLKSFDSPEISWSAPVEWKTEAL
ncbi:hypothetical protein FRC08_018797 [Ceratobasidium sp. 394]|nr:hypothetical protein FRC08_018797 [Ceratobasidium sp. 394]